ncbi:MAG: hypothetical protein FD123_209 [Bacteroidetes bacterium]|nr:MAG: hypothetical protein FD123_209 [Bacteroidota bacterium]
MGNEQLHDKLFQAARQHLKDHEEPFNGSDWDRMNRGLDQLPASRQFKFSFSLNSILVLVGVTGLALGGYALLGGHSSGDANQSLTQPAVAKTAAPVKKQTATQPQPVVFTKPAAPQDNNTVAPPAEVKQNKQDPNADYAAVKEKRHMKNSTGVPREKAPTLEDTGFSPFASDNAFPNVVFPDQIDRRFGPVFETQEDPNRLHNVPEVDPTKLTYYDHVNGQTTPVYIKGDSSKGNKAPEKKNRRKRNKNQGQEPAAGSTTPAGTGTEGQ